MQPTEFLSRHGGAARLAHLRRAGFSRSQISRAVNSGLLLNARHGVYKLPQANCDFVRAYEANAAVTCLSAASHYSLWMLKAPTEPHLAACHRRLPRGVRSHRFSGNISTLQPPVLPLKDVLIHALQCLPELESLVMVECAYSRGEIDLNFLRRLLPGARNGRRVRCSTSWNGGRIRCWKRWPGYCSGGTVSMCAPRSTWRECTGRMTCWSRSGWPWPRPRGRPASLLPGRRHSPAPGRPFCTTSDGIKRHAPPPDPCCQGWTAARPAKAVQECGPAGGGVYS